MHPDEYAQWIAGRMSEATLQAQVVDSARKLGWLSYHTHDSRRSNPGFPDLVLIRVNPPRLIFAELKTQRGKVSTLQQMWLDALKVVANAVRAACGQPLIDVHLWRPIDITTHTIAEVLR